MSIDYSMLEINDVSHETISVADLMTFARVEKYLADVDRLAMNHVQTMVNEGYIEYLVSSRPYTVKRFFTDGKLQLNIVDIRNELCQTVTLTLDELIDIRQVLDARLKQFRAIKYSYHLEI